MEGDRRGRTIGFPTVNLGLAEYLRPAFGVYAVRVAGDGSDDPFAGRWIDGVANIGLRPTVGTPEPRLEANLFDIDADLYGRHLRVALVEFLRPERKFAGLDALKAQIAEDAGERARDPRRRPAHRIRLLRFTAPTGQRPPLRGRAPCRGRVCRRTPPQLGGNAPLSERRLALSGALPHNGAVEVRVVVRG